MVTPISQASTATRLLAKLERRDALDPAGAAALVEAMAAPRALAKGEPLVAQGAPSVALSLLVDGMAYASKALPSGEQQNVAIYVAGDLLDVSGFLLGQSSTSVWALTPVRVAQVSHSALRELLQRYPSIGWALWRDMAVDAAVAQEWMVGMGRRSAYGHVAHLLCEMFLRLRAVGGVSGWSCGFPLSQADLADTLGLSIVHVNRLLQRLRRESLIVLEHGRLTILDWGALTAAGEFDPSYLGLDGPLAEAA